MWVRVCGGGSRAGGWRVAAGDRPPAAVLFLSSHSGNTGVTSITMHHSHQASVGWTCLVPSLGGRDVDISKL